MTKPTETTDLDLAPGETIGFRHNPERIHPCDFGCGGTWVCTVCGAESTESNWRHECSSPSPAAGEPRLPLSAHQATAEAGEEQMKMTPKMVREFKTLLRRIAESDARSAGPTVPVSIARELLRACDAVDNSGLRRMKPREWDRFCEASEAMRKALETGRRPKRGRGRG